MTRVFLLSPAYCGGRRTTAHRSQIHASQAIVSVRFMPRQVSHTTATGVSPAVALFRSLADETRLRIVARLAAGEARVVDLTGELGLAQSTVSKHLACLRGCGLVDYRTEGRQSFYALTRPELMDLPRAAEGVLAATGVAAAPCPISGTGPRAAVA